MAKLSSTSLYLSVLPEGGFAIVEVPYDAPAHWLAAFSTIDEALRFTCSKMLPVVPHIGQGI